MAVEQHSIIPVTKLNKDEYPFLFAEKGYKRSEKYETIVTIDVLKRFLDKDFQVVRISSQDSRKTPKKYQKHIVGLTHKNFESKSDYQTQVVLINSYDGTTKFSIHFGAFVFLCANGLMVGHRYFETPQILHIGADTLQEVEGVAEQVLERSLKLSELINYLKKKTLSQDTKKQIAREAVDVRWHKADKDKDSLPKFPEELLKARRPEDDEIQGTAWGTLNILQENLIKGGFYVTSTNEDKKTLFLREVKSLQLEIMINLLVWNIVCEKARAPLL